MKDCVIVLLPDSLSQTNDRKGYLYGFTRNTASHSTIYVLGVKRHLESDTIGCIGGELGEVIREDWVVVSSEGQVPPVTCLMLGGHKVNCSSIRTLIYDQKTFLRWELFLPAQKNNIDEQNIFETLCLALKLQSPKPKPQFLLDPVISLLVTILTVLDLGFEKCRWVIRISTFATHLADSAHSLLWAMQTLKTERTINLQVGNYLLALLMDFLCGCVVLHFLVQWTSTEEIYSFISNTTQGLVQWLIVLVEWLMGSPAGLKLNHPLSQILGGFFVYNIRAWWAFLALLRPVLEFSFYIFLKLGLLGLSFQIAIVTDVFTIATFHAYCIYIYAARLYELQVSGLWSLSRLVLGRNRNPRPGRVDSCPYTKEQLFLGTMSFTVLLFLLPTTLVYYIVFVAIRLGFKIVTVVLARLRYCIQALPIYSTFVWMFLPSYTTMTMKITPKKSNSGLVLFVRPVCSTWCETTRGCIPPPLTAPPPIPWVDVTKKFFTGKIIHSA